MGRVGESILKIATKRLWKVYIYIVFQWPNFSSLASQKCGLVSLLLVGSYPRVRDRVRYPNITINCHTLLFLNIKLQFLAKINNNNENYFSLFIKL